MRVGDRNIKIKNGVRQGCCLSATLFIAVMAILTKDIPELHVAYADDLCIVIDDNMDVNSLINSIKDIWDLIKSSSMRFEHLDLSNSSDRREIETRLKMPGSKVAMLSGKILKAPRKIWNIENNYEIPTNIMKFNEYCYVFKS